MNETLKLLKSTLASCPSPTTEQVYVYCSQLPMFKYKVCFSISTGASHTVREIQGDPLRMIVFGRSGEIAESFDLWIPCIGDFFSFIKCLLFVSQCLIP
jgi:hypothetical protein